MRKLRFIGPLAAALCVSAVNVATAGQSHYTSDGKGVEITYDDAQWQASALGVLPYFTCNAQDCYATTCLVIGSLDPDFAKWPESMDKASLDALDGIFLTYEKSNGHDEAEIVQSTSPLTIGGRETLVSIIRTKSAETGYLSSKCVFRDGGDTRIVTCEGDEKSMTAYRARVDALIGAVKFKPQ